MSTDNDRDVTDLRQRFIDARLTSFSNDQDAAVAAVHTVGEWLRNEAAKLRSPAFRDLNGALDLADSYDRWVQWFEEVTA
jgi:hypothetical protein